MKNYSNKWNNMRNYHGLSTLFSLVMECQMLYLYLQVCFCREWEGWIRNFGKFPSENCHLSFSESFIRKAKFWIFDRFEGNWIIIAGWENSANCYSTSTVIPIWLNIKYLFPGVVEWKSVMISCDMLFYQNKAPTHSFQFLRIK